MYRFEAIEFIVWDSKTGEEIMRWDPTIEALKGVCEKNEEDKEDEKLG